MKKSLFAWVLGVLFLATNGWACPSVDKISKEFRTIFIGGVVKVVKVQPSPVPGICEVIVEAQGRKRLTYVDQTGRYLIVGRLIDILTKKDLTQERLAELLRLNKKQLQKLDTLVAFSRGKGPVVYLVTDPDCPHCKRAERNLLPLVKEGKITLKVILMPLERLHPQAKQKAVGIICDKKGLEDLIKGYKGSQCAEGQKKVEATVKTLLSLGIRATPTYIFSDGRVISGVLPAEKVLSLVRGKK